MTSITATICTEYAVDYRAGIAHVSTDRAEAEEAVQHYIDAVLVSRIVIASEWDIVDAEIVEPDTIVDCDHPSWTGVDQTPIDDPRKIWSCDVCEVLQVGDGNGPTEEAAALRSAPLANDDEHGDYCEGTHHGGRCYGPDSSCGYCGVGPALKHQPGCTRR